MGDYKSLMRMLFRMPSRSIGTKLFLIFFCFLGASLAGLGLFSSYIANRAIIHQMKESSQNTIKLAGEKLDMKQSFYLDLSNQLISNSDFTKNLFQITNAGIGADELQRRSHEIRGLLDQLAMSEASIRDITLIPVEDSIPVISTEREGVDPGLAESQWAQAVRSADGKPVWLPIEQNGYLGNAPKPHFAYARLLGKSNIGSNDFILLVQIQADVLQTMVDAFKLSQGAETLIITRTNRLIAGSGSNAKVDWSFHTDLEGSGSILHDGTEGRQQLIAYRHSAISDWLFVGIAPLEELTGSVKQIKQTTYWFISINIGIALFIGLWIVMMVGRPLSQMLELMKQAETGHLKGRLSFIKNKDEIGQVALAYNRMMEQIGQLIAETSQTVNEVTSSSHEMAAVAQETALSAKEIHAAADQIAQGAVDLASNAEQGMSRMEQMGTSLAQVLELQGKMSSSAQEVDSVCRRGGASVHELIRKTEYTEEGLKSVADRVNGLHATAQSVHLFLKVMTEMANKTKILSFNASIEATRAGLAGAGFKVISDEIRQLAEQSGASIVSIRELTHGIQTEVGEAVSSFSKALPFFQDMKHEVDVVHELFLSIQKQMDQLIARSAAVGTSLAHLDDTQIMLNRAMQEVSAVSEQSSASTQQVASVCSAQYTVGKKLEELSSRMKDVSEQLDLNIKRFNI
ncbi:methyl-accepting chemotaxis protein [Paenibacillus puerhi]|uniref:methyl-accepting chemotaxis protein n=1 Tax=Paenibacillus puerhi TaxID=2692622 RepID=UPI001358D223|nr:methyl-accepting chemotaxis protein [Paenibacillus puerhi]